MQNSRMNEEPAARDDLVYAYRPSLIGAASEFKLTADALEWSVGRRAGRVPFGKIRRLRMAYRPANMQAHRFVTEIWAEGAPKLQIVSSSWKSMLQQERLDKSYSAFIAELHRRLAQAGAMPRLDQGSNRPLFWLSVIVFVGVELGLAGLVVRALQADANGGAAFVAIFLALFLWQGGDFLRRNRPGVYRADALPPLLMPKG